MGTAQWRFVFAVVVVVACCAQYLFARRVEGEPWQVASNFSLGAVHVAFAILGDRLSESDNRGANAVYFVDTLDLRLRGRVYDPDEARAANPPRVFVLTTFENAEVFEALRAGAADIGKASSAALSGREREVLRLLATGCSNKEIGARLRISEGTVKNHMTNVLDKLGVLDRTQAALRARALGLM